MAYYKVLIIGEVFSGKTSVTARLARNEFTTHYKTTIGCELGAVSLTVNDREVRAELWDIGGQDRGGISRFFCREAKGALVIADIQDDESIKKSSVWKNAVDDNIRASDGSKIPMVLCLNKCDLSERFSEEELEQMKIDLGYSEVFCTSAKTGHNVHESLQKLIEEVVKVFDPKEDLIEKQIKEDTRQVLVKNHTKKKEGCCSK